MYRHFLPLSIRAANMSLRHTPDFGNLGAETGLFWKFQLAEKFPAEFSLYLTGEFHIKKARAGEWITTWRDQGITAWKLVGATDTAQAQLRVAIWVALVARMAHNKALAEYASKMQDAGVRDIRTFAYKRDAASIKRVSDNAIAAIRKALGPVADSNKEVKGVIVLLGEIAKPGAITSAKEVAWDQSATGIVVGTVKGTVADLKKGYDWAVFLTKWGLLLGVGVVAVVGVLWVRGAKRIITKVVPSKTVTNGRRRRRNFHKP